MIIESKVMDSDLSNVTIGFDSAEDIKTAIEAGWKMLNIHGTDSSRVLLCNSGHYCVTNNLGAKCLICAAEIFGLSPIQSVYSDRQKQLEFICKKKHTVTVEVDKISDGCPVCTMEEVFQSGGRTIKFGGTYNSEYTRMRFHCTFCNTESYITHNKWKTLFGPNKKKKGVSTVIWWCKQGHKTNDKKILSIDTASDVVEQIFDCTFNDNDYGLNFTGFNKDLRIAFIHSLDPANARVRQYDMSDIKIIMINTTESAYESLLAIVCKEIVRNKIPTRFDSDIMHNCSERYHVTQLIAQMLYEGRRERKNQINI